MTSPDKITKIKRVLNKKFFGKNKSRIYSFILIALFLTGVFVPQQQTHAQGFSSLQDCINQTHDAQLCADAPSNPGTPGQNYTQGNSGGDWIANLSLSVILKIIDVCVNIIQMVVAGFLGLTGLLLNETIKYSITDLADNISKLGGINIAWTLIRDLCNMTFIFILVYNGIMTIFTGDNRAKKIIVPVIIAALLINFSLFFTKLIIDSSNIVTTSFYNSLITSSSNAQATITTGGGAGTTAQATYTTGLSGAIMDDLHLTGMFSSDAFTADAATAYKLVWYDLGSAIFMLIAAFVFLAAAVLFIIRYVAFLLLLIISPLGYMASVIPGLKGIKDKYWDTLIGQALFAPIFMIMMWIILTLVSPATSGGLFGSTTGVNFAAAITNPTIGSVGIILNYFIIIGLLIAALVVSKDFATKGGIVTTKMVSTATGFAGGLVFGGVARAGRATVGAGGRVLSDNASLQKAAAEKTGFSGAGARLALYATKKARNATFDARNATIPTNTLGDLVEGTVGRTKMGKALTLNDVNIPSVGVGALAANQAGVGAGGTKGNKELKLEREKRVRDREAVATGELALAQAKKDVLNGANALVTSPTYAATINAMEKALSKLSDKETEALVASNRDLLKSQAFANAISVKQLEALNKSDQFSDAEKGTLKEKRFTTLNDPANLAALAVPSTTRTPAEAAAAKKISDGIKALADSELEMIDSAHLANPNFVAQLRPAQIEAFNKSVKFTTTQKDGLKTARMKPLMDALIAGNIPNIQSQIRRTDYKTLAGFMNTDGRTPPGGTTPIKIALDPAVLPIYTPQTLKRMAQEMNDNDIRTLRAAILAGGHPTTIAWLTNPDKGEIEFPG